MTENHFKVNKLMADFLNLETVEDSTYINGKGTKFLKYFIEEEGRPNAPKKLKAFCPDIDWEDLMMVIEGIEKGGGEVVIKKGSCRVSSQGTNPIIRRKDSKREAAYSACYKFLMKENKNGEQ